MKLSNFLYIGSGFLFLTLFLLIGYAFCLDLQHRREQNERKEKDINYRCSSSGVEYIETTKGLAVHVYQDGTPIKCDRWKGY